MHIPFCEIVTTESQLREVLGHPNARDVAKTISTLDQHCRAFIAKCPFLLLASSDARGNVDVSPKGDPPGFVQVLDDRTLAIPDRRGNRRADTFRNLLHHADVGLLFLIPGKIETLRISGTAMIVRDGWLRERMVMQGKTPDFAIVVTVSEAFLHCGKSIMRSNLWKREGWPDVEGLPSLARAIVDHAQLSEPVETVQAQHEESYRERLY